MLLALLFHLSVASAYESDQLTDREVMLAEGTEVTNQLVNTLLAEAVAETNARTRCAADPERTHNVLAKLITKALASPAFVKERGFFRAPGFTTYSAALERLDGLDRRAFEDREDIFGDITLWHSVVLTTAGPTSTVNIDGVLVGTDKFDHFLNFGFIAWKRSRKGARPERAERFSERTERQFFGLLTSKTYSYGDIAANLDGYRFFRDLVTPEGLFALQEGCVVQKRAFDWTEVVDWRYDEVLNPPLFTRLVQKRVTSRIGREPERYCRAYDALGPDYDAHIAEVMGSDGPLPRRYEVRYDPFGLQALCGSGSSR